MLLTLVDGVEELERIEAETETAMRLVWAWAWELAAQSASVVVLGDVIFTQLRPRSSLWVVMVALEMGRERREGEVKVARYGKGLVVNGSKYSY